ncbi:hypothetical protein [Streptomyces sp. NPDC091217]|uniref:Lsr2 family DNA-binding protein n=1 Tax=Streptomyces sp. NPDC091217 TaxID=3365975 RepID=UPI00382005E8
MIGAPTDTDTLTTLLPHLPATATGDPMTTQAPTANAYTATAVDMLTRGDSTDQVRTTLGLSDDEIAEAVQQVEAALAQKPGTEPDTDGIPTDSIGSPEPAPGPEKTDTAPAVPEAGIEALLAWGEQHTAKGVQALAAKARTALAELAGRRATEQAVTDAEGRVERLERELARAREQLRVAKTGKPAPVADATPASNGRFSKTQLDAIRTWARANGYTVSNLGNPARSVVDAYFDANPTTAKAAN